jgi:hypothetical protein
VRTIWLALLVFFANSASELLAAELRVVDNAGPWKIAEFDDGSAACVASREYDGGFALSFFVQPGGGISYIVYYKDWDFKEATDSELPVTLDGRSYSSDVRANGKVIIGSLANVPNAYEAISNASIFAVGSGEGMLQFDLSGSRVALVAASNCAGGPPQAANTQKPAPSGGISADDPFAKALRGRAAGGNGAGSAAPPPQPAPTPAPAPPAAAPAGSTQQANAAPQEDPAEADKRLRENIREIVGKSTDKAFLFLDRAGLEENGFEEDDVAWWLGDEEILGYYAPRTLPLGGRADLMLADLRTENKDVCDGEMEVLDEATFNAKSADVVALLYVCKHEDFDLNESVVAVFTQGGNADVLYHYGFTGYLQLRKLHRALASAMVERFDQ